MSVADLPPGQWTQLLIGDQWPAGPSLDALFANASSRQRMALAFERYADLMLTIKNEALASQEGITADDARVAFDQGISSARQIAELNRAKEIPMRLSIELWPNSEAA